METLNIEIPFKEILREAFQKLNMLPLVFSTKNDGPDNAKKKFMDILKSLILVSIIYL